MSSQLAAGHVMFKCLLVKWLHLSNVCFSCHDRVWWSSLCRFVLFASDHMSWWLGCLCMGIFGKSRLTIYPLQRVLLICNESCLSIPCNTYPLQHALAISVPFLYVCMYKCMHTYMHVCKYGWIEGFLYVERGRGGWERNRARKREWEGERQREREKERKRERGRESACDKSRERARARKRGKERERENWRPLTTWRPLVTTAETPRLKRSDCAVRAAVPHSPNSTSGYCACIHLHAHECLHSFTRTPTRTRTHTRTHTHIHTCILMQPYGYRHAPINGSLQRTFQILHARVRARVRAHTHTHIHTHTHTHD